MTTLLEVKDLKVYFKTGKRGILGEHSSAVRAVDGVSFQIRRGETLGLVGESGSGKTTLGRAIIRAIEPTEGKMLYYRDEKCIDFNRLNRNRLRTEWRHMQMIFQDPYASLNPRMTVRDIIAEPLIVNRLARGENLQELILETARQCGLSDQHMSRYPHAFSGGQRQRIAIARALVLHPEFIICDEPVSALDVSIQAQILNLLLKLQNKLRLTYLFIAHDLTAVAYASDRVAVMYLGQLVEIAATEKLYYTPKHPYTEALMSAIPPANPNEVMEPVFLEGERPSQVTPPSGCRFHTRCRYATHQCKSSMPTLQEFDQDHYVACHLAKELHLKGAQEYLKVK